MKNNLKILYNNTAWTLSDEIKSVTVIKEIDITKMSAPTTAVDITLKCTPDTDFDFALDCPCDIYNNDTPIFKLYVSDSARNSDYEWKLSLYGALGRMASKKYYGDVYSEPADFENDIKNYPSDDVYYTPTISDIAGIIDDISSVSGANITYDSSLFPLVNETLHRVNMQICSSREALLNAAFVLGAQMRDEYGSVILFRTNETVKQISDDRVLNDAKIQKTDTKNIKLNTYQLYIRASGRVWYIHDRFKDSTGRTHEIGEYVWRCDITPREHKTSDGRIVEVGGNFVDEIDIKLEDEDHIIEFKNPISTYNFKENGGKGQAPKNPNYANIDEEITGSYAMRYEIRTNTRNLVTNANSENDLSEIKVQLVSPEIADLIADRVKNDFSYNRIATVNIVEAYDKALYGEHKFGECKYGYNEQESIDIGDKVKFNIRSKPVEGYITRVKYNLNGTIIIKNCEVTFKE